MSSVQPLPVVADYRVADISLAAWGRREISIRRKRDAGRLCKSAANTAPKNRSPERASPVACT